MKPADREQWILAWLRKRQELSATKWRVDVLDANFVDMYIDATKATFKPSCFGAHNCRQLGRDLSRLYTQGRLTRCTAGISDGLCYQGFPRWVWSYALKEQA